MNVKMLKNLPLKHLTATERSSHRLGSCSEEKVQSVIHSVIVSLSCEMIDAFESGLGLLCSKTWKYLSTSLDGWIVMKRTEK